MKHILTIGVMAVLAVVIPLHYVGGGLGEVFRRVHEVQPQMLTVHGGAQDQVWWTTSVLVSAIAGGMMAKPHHPLGRTPPQNRSVNNPANLIPC